jgi:hypothetical protein
LHLGERPIVHVDDGAAGSLGGHDAVESDEVLPAEAVALIAGLHAGGTAADIESRDRDPGSL